MITKTKCLKFFNQNYNLLDFSILSITNKYQVNKTEVLLYVVMCVCETYKNLKILQSQWEK